MRITHTKASEAETMLGYPSKLNKCLFYVNVFLGTRLHGTKHFISLSKSRDFLERHLAHACQITFVAFTSHRSHHLLMHKCNVSMESLQEMH